MLDALAPVEAVLARSHTLLEAPRIDRAGRHVFADVGLGGVYAHAGGEIEEVLPKRRGIGGLVEHADGGFVVSGRDLRHVAPGRPDRVVLDGEGFTGLNDLHTLPDGLLLAGALRFRPMAGEEPVPGAVLVVDAAGSARVLTERLRWPNGIGVAPAGDRLYVSDFADGTVWTLALDGGDAEVFARVPDGSADGLAVDAGGGVWVALGAGGGVARFRPDGTLDAVTDVPAGFVSSLSFGGADGRDVLLTTADNRVTPETGGTLFTARAAVAGVPTALAAV